MSAFGGKADMQTPDSAGRLVAIDIDTLGIENAARWPGSSKRLALNVLPCGTRRLTDPSVR